MEFALAVFRSKTETLNFANLLKSYDVPCSIVTTPRIINVSCGISVKFSLYDLSPAKSIIVRRKFDSFAGFYKITQIGLRQTATRL